MKKLITILALFAASAGFGAESHTQVLLIPIEAARANMFDWQVFVATNPVPEGNSTADVGKLKGNLDLERLFKEGYVIYSITEIPAKAPFTVSHLYVFVRPRR